MRRLIVNADDLGLSKSINEGIARAFRDGIVTYMSVIPTGDAFDDAAQVVNDLALKEIGAHLALTETAPLSDRSSVRTLTATGGRFFRGYGRFFPRYLLGMIDKGQIYAELKAQMDALRALNIPVTNLSSHEHVHIIPGILSLFMQLAREYKIPSIRLPCEDAHHPRSIHGRYRSLVLSLFVGRMASALPAAEFYRPEHFLGFIDSGCLTEKRLIEMVSGLHDGTTELVCHPGFLSPGVLDAYPWHKGCEEELFALTSPRVRRALDAKGVKLIGYREAITSR